MISVGFLLFFLLFGDSDHSDSRLIVTCVLSKFCEFMVIHYRAVLFDKCLYNQMTLLVLAGRVHG